ncbi:hypothetical protein EMIT0194P_10068 [Pseudomonas serbica]
MALAKAAIYFLVTKNYNLVTR